MTTAYQMIEVEERISACPMGSRARPVFTDAQGVEYVTARAIDGRATCRFVVLVGAMSGVRYFDRAQPVAVYQATAR